MDFEITQQIDAGVEAVADALCDADFITATSALPRLDDCMLLSRKDDDDAVRLQIHRRFGADLSGAVRRVIDPAKLTWVEHVTYEPARHRATHVIDPDHYADRLRCSYLTQLTERDGGTLRTTRGTLSVRAPLVARKVEAAIVDGLEEYAAAEARLLGDWRS